MRSAPHIARTPMLGVEQRWTVYYEHPVNGQPFQRGCVTRWGAQHYVRRILSAYRKAGVA